MKSKRLGKAERKVLDELARCRYLLRNPAFIKDLRRLREICQRIWKWIPPAPSERPKNGEFIRVSDYLAQYGPGTEYDRYIEAARKADLAIHYLLTRYQAKWRYPFQEFVIMGMPSAPIGSPECIRHLDGWLATYFTTWGLNHFCANSKPTPGKRRRPDKASFQLTVYSLAMEGMTFLKIASHLNKPESTVKSAYKKARESLFGKPPETGEDIRWTHTKRKAPIALFDPSTHRQDCPACASGDYCLQWYAYANQDYVSMRGFLGFDTIADARPELFDGNRHIARKPGLS